MDNLENKNRCIEGIFEYHERTKHLPDRYAKSTGHLDWANEPNPFRTYPGSNVIHLPLIETDPKANYFSLYDRKNNGAHDFSLKNIGAFIELSMGLSAWKSYEGNSWALRINPSSGNLHPTEAHFVLPHFRDSENSGGVFHYNPLLHALEQRAEFDDTFWPKIKGHFNEEGFFVALSSIYCRESWKYGERAFRYCNHDVGHAMACLGFSGNLLGWKITYLSSLSDKDIETILGFSNVKWRKNEKEVPDILFFVHKNLNDSVPGYLPVDVIRSFEDIQFKGKPNLLCLNHVEWDVIEEVSSMTEKPVTDGNPYHSEGPEYLEKELPGKSAAKIIRQRRSAQAYDCHTEISKEHFFAIMDKTIPRNNCAPFDLGLGEVSVHLLIFVHRVTDLDSGLYFLIRNDNDLAGIKQHCHPYFFWKRVHIDKDRTLPLFLLRKGDLRNEAGFVSCRQDIAGNGAFSVGMIAKYRENIEKRPFMYRRLFWETGMIGQILYLEAEAHSLRGTGIGCFYDDLVHKLLGIKDDTYQSLYHFTIGGPLEDARLKDLPPYKHLEKMRQKC